MNKNLHVYGWIIGRFCMWLVSACIDKPNTSMANNLFPVTSSSFIFSVKPSNKIATIQHTYFIHTRVTRRVPLVVQDLLPFWSTWGSCCSIYMFCVVFCRSLFVLFHLVIVLSVLRFTNYDYLFSIVKLLIRFVCISRQYILYNGVTQIFIYNIRLFV